jgi:hypothetical protein
MMQIGNAMDVNNFCVNHIRIFRIMIVFLVIIVTEMRP